jgi:hypothetical protein
MNLEMDKHPLVIGNNSNNFTLHPVGALTFFWILYQNQTSWKEELIVHIAKQKWEALI